MRILEFSKFGVRVTNEDGSKYRADDAIVSVSTGDLQSTLIDFVPDLPVEFSLRLSDCWLLFCILEAESDLLLQPALGMTSTVKKVFDGWDRTAQLVALASLLLDPHHRTFQGFQAHIKKDWLAFGHMFSNRLENPTFTGTPNLAATDSVMSEAGEGVLRIHLLLPSVVNLRVHSQVTIHPFSFSGWMLWLYFCESIQMLLSLLRHTRWSSWIACFHAGLGISSVTVRRKGFREELQNLLLVWAYLKHKRQPREDLPQISFMLQLRQVHIRNKGIDWDCKSNVYWQHRVRRLQALESAWKTVP